VEHWEGAGPELRKLGQPLGQDVMMYDLPSGGSEDGKTEDRRRKTFRRARLFLPSNWAWDGLKLFSQPKGYSPGLKRDIGLLTTRVAQRC
jgi:hypothetical protein